MNIFTAKKSDFYSLPKIAWDADMNGKQFDSIIILPERRKHDSGYMCMSFVGCIGDEAVAIMGGCSDVLHIDGIGGRGKDWRKKPMHIPMMVPAKRWSIDCLPCGCLRIFPSGYGIEIGHMLSSFEIFAERKTEDETKSET